MSSGRVFRFAPAKEHKTNHLFVFLHGCGATAQSMIPIAFKFQARFPSAALVVPSGFDPDARGGAAQDWYPTRGLNCDNHRERVAAVLPDFEDLVRREQTNFGVAVSRTVLVGFSQGGTLALEAVKTPGIAGAVVAFSSRYARLPARGARIGSRIHLVHGEFDSVVSRVYAERAARVKCTQADAAAAKAVQEQQEAERYRARLNSHPPLLHDPVHRDSQLRIQLEQETPKP